MLVTAGNVQAYTPLSRTTTAETTGGKSSITYDQTAALALSARRSLHSALGGVLGVDEAHECWLARLQLPATR